MNQALANARTFWSSYIWGWLYFPVLVSCARLLDISFAEWWFPLTLFSLAAGIVPWVPWFRGRINYSANAIWAIAAPFLTLLLAVVVTSAIEAI